MAVSLLFKICTRWQPLWYNIQNTAVFLLLKTFITKWQSLWYSEHSSQNGSLFDTQNIHHKMAVSLILRTFITKWQSLWYSEHSSQNGSLFDTQNIHHKMAVSLLVKTLTGWGCLCYSEYSYLVFFFIDILTDFQLCWNLNVPTNLELPDTKFHYKHFVCSPSDILAQKQTHYPRETINKTEFESRVSTMRSRSAKLSRENFY
jgi:hypothetical protein